LQSTNWSTSRLFITFVVAPAVVVLIYLIVWTLTQNWNKHFTISNSVIYQECEYSSGFTIVSLVVGIGFLLWIVQLAVSVRGVPKNFNESRWLGASVYTISIVFLFVIPLALVNSVGLLTQRVFVMVGSFLATEAVLLSLFGIKFLKIWTGKAQKPARKTGNKEASSVVSSTRESTATTDRGESSKPSNLQLGRVASVSDDLNHQRSLSSEEA